jgi:thymidylate synthase (FAD)
MELTYIDHMGSDLETVNDARVSFNKKSTELGSRDEKLISYLAIHDHWTPFAHQQLKIRAKVPIFLARQWFKHQIGAVYNEVSRRYVDTEVELWHPEAWRSRPNASIKQGSGEPLIDQNGPQEAYQELLAQSLMTYHNLLDQGVCPEQARAVLPQSMMTEFIVTGSLVYWSRLYQLRKDSTAQEEWLTITSELDKIVRNKFPISWKELTNDR